jgi:DNA-binding transcriptional LysR family regulator
VLASQVVAPLLPGFRQRYPRIHLDIDVDSSGDPLVEQFDIALIPTDEALDAGVVARKVAESPAVLVASPAYLERRGLPRLPQDLAGHDCLRLKVPHGRFRALRLWPVEGSAPPASVDVAPVLWANHSDTLLRAALDGVGITAVALDLAAPHLARGALVRVLPAWITGRLAIYAALPSRKFIPLRTRVFLDFLVEQTRQRASQALQACAGQAAPEGS